MHCDYISVLLLQLFGNLCNLAYHLQHSGKLIYSLIIFFFYLYDNRRYNLTVS